MQITFWGVRGSYPVPGAATVRYGGQTSCVEARTESGETIIVDAGTGMRQLGNKLAREAAGAPGQYHVLLSHVHWDHIQGLPFFSPAYIPGTKISVYALLTAADELNQVIGGITRHEFFPMPLEAVPASFDFQKVEPAALGTVRQQVKIQQGIPIEKSKEIVKAIKDRKLKVQASIQADQVRVVGRAKDDLQEVMAMLRGGDFGVPLQFTNYR